MWATAEVRPAALDVPATTTTPPHTHTHARTHQPLLPSFWYSYTCQDVSWVAAAAGKYYTVNVPLKDGMDDDNYRLMFEPIMSKV